MGKKERKKPMTTVRRGSQRLPTTSEKRKMQAVFFLFFARVAPFPNPVLRIPVLVPELPCDHPLSILPAERRKRGDWADGTRSTSIEVPFWPLSEQSAIESFPWSPPSSSTSCSAKKNSKKKLENPLPSPPPKKKKTGRSPNPPTTPRSARSASAAPTPRVSAAMPPASSSTAVSPSAGATSRPTGAGASWSSSSGRPCPPPPAPPPSPRRARGGSSRGPGRRYGGSCRRSRPRPRG